METLSTIFLIVASFVIIAAYMWFLGLLIRKGLWFIAYLIMPVITIIIFSISYWKEARKPFVLTLISISLFFLAFRIIEISPEKKGQTEMIPSEVDVLSLIKDDCPENRHILIKKHYREYSDSLFIEGKNEKTVYCPIFISGNKKSYKTKNTVFIEIHESDKKAALPRDGYYYELFGMYQKGNAGILEYMKKNYKEYPGNIILIKQNKKPYIEEKTKFFPIVTGSIVFLVLLCLFLYFMEEENKPVEISIPESNGFKKKMPPPLKKTYQDF